MQKIAEANIQTRSFLNFASRDTAQWVVVYSKYTPAGGGAHNPILMCEVVQRAAFAWFSRYRRPARCLHVLNSLFDCGVSLVSLTICIEELSCF